jgi:hypothetical protein
MPLWTPSSKSKSYTATIRVAGPKKTSEMKSFRNALKKLVRKAKGKVREKKPKK